MNVRIRKSKRNDMEHVINLIEELAEFERMPNRLKINVQILEHDGFDVEHPLFYCYVAETSKSEIVAYALYYNTYSTWLGKSLFLEDLYVKPQYRRTGIGRQLFLAVAKEAYDLKTRLDFQVLSWNPALKFYEKFGAVNLTNTEQWNSIRMDFQSLEKLFDKNE